MSSRPGAPCQSRNDQLTVRRGPRDVGPGPRVQLRQDVRDVRLHGAPGHLQPGGDVRVGQALRDQAGDPDLGRGQRLPAGDRAPADPVRSVPKADAAQPRLRAAQVPRGLQAQVEVGRLVERRARRGRVAAPGQQYRPALQGLRAGQHHTAPRIVVDGSREEIRVPVEQCLAVPGHGGGLRPHVRRGLGDRGGRVRRGLGLPPAGQREPDDLRQIAEAVAGRVRCQRGRTRPKNGHQGGLDRLGPPAGRLKAVRARQPQPADKLGEVVQIALRHGVQVGGEGRRVVAVRRDRRRVAVPPHEHEPVRDGEVVERGEFGERVVPAPVVEVEVRRDGADEHQPLYRAQSLGRRQRRPDRRRYLGRPAQVHQGHRAVGQQQHAHVGRLRTVADDRQRPLHAGQPRLLVGLPELVCQRQRVQRVGGGEAVPGPFGLGQGLLRVRPVSGQHRVAGEQPGPPDRVEPAAAQDPVEHATGLREPAQPAERVRQGPAGAADGLRIGGLREDDRPGSGHVLVAGEQGQRGDAVPGELRPGAVRHPLDQLQGGLRRAVDQGAGRAGQPLRRPAVGTVAVPAGEQLLGDHLHPGPGLGQRPRRLPVQRHPQRRRRLLVQRGADQPVPERHPVGRGDQYPGRDRLVDDAGQVDRGPAGHHAQVGHGRLRTEQRGDPQHVAGALGEEVQPRADRGGQRRRYRRPAQFGGTAGDPYPLLAHQRRDHLVQVQGVPAGLVDGGAQPRTGRRAGQGTGQLGHVRRVERRQVQYHPVRPAHPAAQRRHLRTPGYRPARTDQQQRYLRHQPP